MEEMKEKLQEALAKRQKRYITRTDRTRSAVLIPVYYREGECFILFAKRTDMVTYHKGQISFPGGAYEDRDGSLLNTALRESFEEVGLAPGDVEVLGELDDIVTRTSYYIVSPFIGIIPCPYPLKADTKEIEKVIEVPVSCLLDNNCLREEPAEEEDGELYTQYFYRYNGEVIWGATARILTQLLDILRQIMSDNVLECKSE